jgi:hypothetical protein
VDDLFADSNPGLSKYWPAVTNHLLDILRLIVENRLGGKGLGQIVEAKDHPLWKQIMKCSLAISHSVGNRTTVLLKHRFFMPCEILHSQHEKCFSHDWNDAE